MKMFDAFSKIAPNKVFLSIVLGALAGIAYAFLIPIVLNSVTPEEGRGLLSARRVDTFLTFEVSNYKLAALFFFNCVFILVARSSSQIMLLRVSMDMATELRRTIYRRIARAPIAYLERTGSSKLITSLTGDVGRIVMGARILPDLLISLVTLIGMLGFLLYMNASAFLFVIGAIIFGIITYQIPMYLGNRYFHRARVIADDLQESIRGLIHGAKELKLNHGKRENFFSEMLDANESAIVGLEKSGFSIIRAAMNYGDLISFFVIGVITFVFVNYHALNNAELLGVIMALLYVTGPVTSILNCIPSIVIARVALKKINQLLDELPEEAGADGVPVALAWDRLRFDGVCYRHGGADGAGFAVGPISFDIQRGQVTFIIGGNGSGKSTLSKLLTLHYLPSAGAISFGDTVVNPDTVASCRQEIGAIFSDYYLFDRLFCNLDDAVQRRIDDYLAALGLDHKVTVKDGRFSTLALSDGQKKRLALLVSFLEDKNLYLFDEWAADQDVTFKRVFYDKLLPELKARNKAVVVISHDERYFGVADQTLVMEEGLLLRTENSARGEPHAAPVSGADMPACV